MDGYQAPGQPADAGGAIVTAERRHTLRLLGYWRAFCGEDRLPTFGDIDLARVPDMPPHCFTVDLPGPGGMPTLTSVGDRLAAQTGSPPIGHPISDIAPDTLLGVALADVEQVVRDGLPFYRVGEFSDFSGIRQLYRAILLPVGNTGNTVTGILGTANCRPAGPN